MEALLTGVLYVLYAAFVPTVCVRFVNDLRRWWVMANVDPRSEEQRDRYFETFKHLTTLDVATAAFVLALFRENEEGLAAIRLPLVLFAVSLLAALGGLDTLVAGRSTGGRLEVLYYAALVPLVLGLAVFFVQLAR